MADFHKDFYDRTVRVLASKLDEAQSLDSGLAAWSETERVRDVIRWLDIENAVNERRDGGEVDG